MQYLGIDWGTRRANWCALSPRGALQGGHDHRRPGRPLQAGADGSAAEVHGCIEMMSGAVWVRDQLATSAGDPDRGRPQGQSIAPLACKTDRVDARVLADLARRDLIPEGVGAPDRRARNRERCAGART